MLLIASRYIWAMGRFHAENPGELIREARLDAGLTQAELAQRAGLRQPSLAQMESGNRTVSSDMLERVLKAADYRPNLALVHTFHLIRKAAAKRGLRNVRVFGSVARGEDGYDSDVDLLVSPDEGVTMFDIANFGDDVHQITGFPADVIVDNGTFPPHWTVLNEAVPV